MTANSRTVLWWGRFDPDYSRNRIVRKLFAEQGWSIVDFRPTLSRLGALEARLKGVSPPDLVWVPCFRQRDARAATAWARSVGAPVAFDPLISAYDKQVFERARLKPDSAGARRLLAWEQSIFCGVDLVFADTGEHLRYFADIMQVPEKRLALLPVGAEESLFYPAPLPPLEEGPLEVLFFGSFIGLQGPEWIVQAARCYHGPPVTWRLLGEGPLLARCKALAEGMGNVAFEPWLAYEALPSRIHQAHILLGIFGTSVKAGRVIPNKVYQALACGRPVITRGSDAYPEAVTGDPDSGISWVAPGSPEGLAGAVAELASHPERLPGRGKAAAATYAGNFGNRAIGACLLAALSRLGLESPPGGRGKP